MDTADNTTVEQYLAAWADLVSLLLLCVAIVIQGGIDPRRTVWGRSPTRNVLNILFMGLNIIFSAGRLIAEGILVETGPREFLLLSVIYTARWLWLYAAITKSDSRAARAFEVALQLRKLNTIRLGPSTSLRRKGKTELVIRRGARVVIGEPYWRGVEEYVKRRERKGPYKVRLVEKELHSSQLDEIGTVDFKRKLETDSKDALYKKFYDLVLTVESGNKDLKLDYSEFLDEYEAIRETSRLPQRVGAIDTFPVANVARRIAADACFYIWAPDGELRTKRQVELLNKSVENAATAYMGVANLGPDGMRRKDIPHVYSENDWKIFDCFGGRTRTESPV